MFDSILLPYDGLKTTIPSVKYSIRLAQSLNSKLYILHIIPKEAYDSAKVYLKKPDRYIKEYCLQRSKGLFDEIILETKRSGFNNYEACTQFSQDVSTGINDFVKRKNIDLCILQPSPYKNYKKIGDLAKQIFNRIGIPTLFVNSAKSFGKRLDLLVPIDEKKENLSSAFIAIDLCKTISGKIIFYHTTWIKKGLSKKDLRLHCKPSVLENLDIVEKKAKENNIKFKILLESEETIEGGIIKSAVKNKTDIIIMTKSTSLIGGKPDLVMNHSMYPLLMIDKIK